MIPTDDPGTLWVKHRRLVTAVLCAHAPAGADVEDLLQEVALIFVAKAGSIREPDALRGWLRTVALNTARMAGRSAAARRAAGPTETLDEGPEAAPEPGAGARERLADALGWIRGLPPELREPLLLKAVDGLGQREIAGLLGVPETTVETRLSRARRILREQASAAGRDGVTT